MAFVRGARAGQREQVAGHFDSGRAAERLGLGHRDRAAGRRVGVARVQGRSRPAWRQPGPAAPRPRHLGGQLAVAADDVWGRCWRFATSRPGPLRRTAWPCPATNQPASRSAPPAMPALDRGVVELGPRAELLGHRERLPVGDNQGRIDRHVVERGGAADRGPLAHHVPVVVDLDAVGVALDEGQHELAVVVQRADPDPAGRERAGAVVLAAVQPQARRPPWCAAGSSGPGRAGRRARPARCRAARRPARRRTARRCCSLAAPEARPRRRTGSAPGAPGRSPDRPRRRRVTSASTEAGSPGAAVLARAR